jgi:hypothetical protein
VFAEGVILVKGREAQSGADLLTLIVSPRQEGSKRGETFWGFDPQRKQGLIATGKYPIEGSPSCS